jgi:hypothetical protein
MVMEKPIKAGEKEDEELTALYGDVAGRVKKLEHM